MNEIVVTGSIAYDYLMRFPGKFREQLLLDKLDMISLSFLVDDMARHWGGSGANIAYNLGLLGYRPRLAGTVGRDFADYRTWLEQNGVDTSAVVVEEQVFTASFFANTDEENNQIASFYGGAMNFARNYSLEQTIPMIPDYVIISPNDPVAMANLVEECIRRGIPFMYDPSQQIPRLDAETLRRGVENCHALTVNEYEWEMLSRKVGMSEADVLKKAKVFVRTLGKKGAEIFTAESHYPIPIYPTEQITDPTGVGDAFRAGLLVSMAFNIPWDVAGRAASLAAAYALEQVGTQVHRYTPEAFITRYREVFDDQGALDALKRVRS
ncbi:MAG TPA: carbohydrate kinase family protein [Aggregatilineales bacterium]|nr:carbohydrate kinase family protein [Anaerolineales bacterium]HRE49098.1 carbohydrate kinase family protein [Aggregatilineales bacterium]